MSINFAQTTLPAAGSAITALLIIRGKMMQTKPWDKKNEHHRRFYRIFEALEAARRWELPRTSAMLKHQLESMGGWEDEAGFFHDDTRPIKPIDDASCTDLAAGWEV